MRRYWIALYVSRHCTIQYLIIVIYARVYCTGFCRIQRYYIVLCYTRLHYTILDYGVNASVDYIVLYYALITDIEIICTVVHHTHSRYKKTKALQLVQ